MWGFIDFNLAPGRDGFDDKKKGQTSATKMEKNRKRLHHRIVPDSFYPLTPLNWSLFWRHDVMQTRRIPTRKTRLLIKTRVRRARDRKLI